MADALALVAAEEGKFQKNIRGIKSLIKSGKIKPRTDKAAKEARARSNGVQKKSRKERGLVYISHIPHGFYENEMTQYFKQFGVVTNARVIRSKKTGQSKGCAFVEFLEPTVAKIVAETMNNYLMGKRLLKAELVPPEKQKKNALRKNWNAFENPSSEYRRQMKRVYNENGTKEDDLKLAKKQIVNVKKTQKKLKEMGIDYDFFAPVEVPEELQHFLTDTSSYANTASAEKQDEPQQKKGKKQKLETTEVDPKSKKVKLTANKVDLKANDFINLKADKIDLTSNKVAKNVDNKKGQSNEKAKKKQDDFIKINNEEESEESDDEFDSDAFEMTLESDDDGTESDNDGTESGEESVDDEKSEQEVTPVKKPKVGKKPNSAGVSALQHKKSNLAPVKEFKKHNKNVPKNQAGKVQKKKNRK